MKYEDVNKSKQTISLIFNFDSILYIQLKIISNRIYKVKIGF